MPEFAFREGDLVVTPGDKLGIVVGIYGLGYCEVLINKGTHNARVVPYRHIDLKNVLENQNQPFSIDK